MRLDHEEIFNFVEFLLCNGDDDVQTAITTSYLEYLMSKDPDEIQFTTFVINPSYKQVTQAA